MRQGIADVVIDEELARRLLAQFADLRVDSLRLFAEGWDNAVWLVNERWAFRFPRRTIAIPGVERELAALPRLAPLLPLPIPTPVFFGQPADGYPWPFFGSELLPGREISDVSLDDAARHEVALELASFLRRRRAGFLDAYGQVTDDQLLRARVLAFSLAAALARYGHQEGMAGVEREAIEGLERAASD